KPQYVRQLAHACPPLPTHRTIVRATPCRARKMIGHHSSPSSAATRCAASRRPPFPFTPKLCPAALEPRLERRLYRRLTLPVVADQRVAIDRPQPRQGRPDLALRLTGDRGVLRRAALDQHLGGQPPITPLRCRAQPLRSD